MRLPRVVTLLAVFAPILTIVFVVLCVVLTLWMAPKIYQTLRGLLRRLGSLLSAKRTE